MLNPEELNNEIYLNIKKKLEKNKEGRCFSNYGYITKIYEITEYKNNLLHPENMTASVLFNVTFSCQICRPIKNQMIICKVDKINRMLLRLKNGPINVIVTNDRINDQIFFSDNMGNLRYKKDNKSIELMPSDYVKITIINHRFNDGDRNILVIGYLEDIANDKEIEDFIKTNVTI
jgi:DNA-directed RNA polymerase subunit E'/Rpb7